MSARWHVGCDHCGAGAWIGPGPEDRGAWCEACQAGVVLPRDAAPGRARCQRCGGPLATESLRSEELWGEIQHLAAVLDAWRGDPGPLASLLPVRPRFITDLTPPEPAEEDDHATRAALATLARGAFGDARARLEEAVEDGRCGARLWQALAVAYERLAQPSLAEWAWSQVLERGESQTARLARGVLEARRGDFEGARDDLERAGDGFEARWDRAALMVLEAVAGTPGLPDPGVLARARRPARSRRTGAIPPSGGCCGACSSSAPGRARRAATLRALRARTSACCAPRSARSSSTPSGTARWWCTATPRSG